MSVRPIDFVLAALALLGPLAIHLFLPIIPVAKTEFGLSEALAQLTFSIGIIGLAFSTLAYGTFADRYGRRPVLLVGLVLFVFGSVISALAISFTTLLVGRVIQSVGAGCGITLARAIARDVYGDQGLVKGIAYLTMFYAAGALLAPGIGGLLLDIAGWRSAFFLATFIGVGTAIAAHLVVPETRAQGLRTGSSPILSGFFELLRQPRFCALVIHTGCSTGTFLIIASASSTLMKELLHRSATEFGLYFAMIPAGFVIGTMISSRIGNRASVERMILIGGLIGVIAVVVQSVFFLFGYLSPLVLFLPGSFVTLAQGISLPFAQAAAMRIVPILAGTAAGIGVFAQNFLGAGFAQIYGILADGTPVPMMQMASVTAGLALVSAYVARLPSLAISNK